MTSLSAIKTLLLQELDRVGRHCAPELADRYAALVVSLGVETTASDVHEAWADWTRSQGREHACLVPFDELTFEQQIKDEPYADVIRALAARMSG